MQYTNNAVEEYLKDALDIEIENKEAVDDLAKQKANGEKNLENNTENTNKFVKEYLKDVLDLEIKNYKSFDDLDKKKVNYINDTYIENDELYKAYLRSKEKTFRIFKAIYDFVNMKETDPVVFYTILKSMFTLSVFFIVLAIITIFTIPILFYVLFDFESPITYKIYSAIIFIILIYYFMIKGYGI